MLLAQSLAVVAFALHASAFGGFPTVCAWGPTVPVEAGSKLSARIELSNGKRCEAVLRFVDPTYLPLTWSFDSANCTGLQVAELSVPLGVPNGDAFITWQCAGPGPAYTCNHITITNGLGNIDNINPEQVGTVGCISEIRLTTTTTVTRTSSNSVIVETSAFKTITKFNVCQKQATGQQESGSPVPKVSPKTAADKRPATHSRRGLREIENIM